VVARHLCGEIDWVATLNEPNLATISALVGDAARPVAQQSLTSTLELATRKHPGGEIGFRPMFLWQGDHLERYSHVHARARDVIKEHLDVPVGWTLAAEDYQAVPGAEGAASDVRARALDDWLEVSKDDDYVGVQNYTRRVLAQDRSACVPKGAPTNDMGWELHSPSLSNVVRHVAAFTGRPVVVTEHGIATRDDTLRLAFTRESLAHLSEAVAEGVDVRGYLHWTLLDEFEWDFGYDVSFGLVEVDRETFRRSPRGSARWLGELARRVGSRPSEPG
jgi:beta-glucosidase